MARLPTELLDQILEYCVSDTPPSSQSWCLKLRRVNHHFHDRVTPKVLGRYLSHVTLKASNFRLGKMMWMLNERTCPAVQHLKVWLRPAGTKDDQRNQPLKYANAVDDFLHLCKAIHTIEIFFDKAFFPVEPEDADENPVWTSADRIYLKPLCNKYWDQILDTTVQISRRHFQETKGHRNIRVTFCETDAYTNYRSLIACAGRNDGIIVAGGYRREWFLWNAPTGPGSPAGPRPTPSYWYGDISKLTAQWACWAMGHILDDYLGPSVLDLGHQRWSFVAEHITHQCHILIGASTASATDLYVPVSVRQPFDKAISELDEAANIFKEVADTGNKAGIHNARLCISRAHATLQAACDAENARIRAAPDSDDAVSQSEDEDDEKEQTEEDVSDESVSDEDHSDDDNYTGSHEGFYISD